VRASSAAAGGRTFVLPAARGPLTEELFATLLDTPDREIQATACSPVEDPLADEDLQLALYVCYELHYARIEGVDERWEWAPSLLRLRGELEQQLEDSLAALVAGESSAEALAPEASPRESLGFEASRLQAPGVGASPQEPARVGAALQEIVAEDRGPALSRYVETQATLAEVLELVMHRSAYQLKEADPHSWMIPRLSGAPKAALLEVQFDEYGEGRAERIHAALFARTMLELGLDPSYGAYVQELPAITLAAVNLMSCFGLHRRLRGALVGHLAAFEMTSSLPNRRYGNALRRLGFGAQATDFYDEHVTADAVHEAIAAWDLADGLAAAEPDLAGQILFGARALLAVEARWAEHLLSSWRQGASSLLQARQTA
jgi:hypothetical protein